MKKYALPAVLLIAGHEVISILALIIASGMFICDIAATAEKERRF